MAKGHFEGLGFAITLDFDREFLSFGNVEEEALKVDAISDVVILDGENHIACFEACFFAGAAWLWLFDDEMSIFAVLLVFSGKAVISPSDGLCIEEVCEDTSGIVDRNREADALCSCADGDVDADDFAIEIEQWTARVTRVDTGVSLDEVVIRLCLVDFNIPAEVTDDA